MLVTEAHSKGGVLCGFTLLRSVVMVSRAGAACKRDDDGATVACSLLWLAKQRCLHGPRLYGIWW